MTAARVGRLNVERSDAGDTAAAAAHPRSRLQTRSGRRFVLAAGLAAVVSIAFTIWIGFRVGGDHSVTLAELRALAKRHGPMALVQLDSHGDVWEQYF